MLGQRGQPREKLWNRAVGFKLGYWLKCLKKESHTTDLPHLNLAGARSAAEANRKQNTTNKNQRENKANNETTIN
jgi:hypothetical protein